MSEGRDKCFLAICYLQYLPRYVRWKAQVAYFAHFPPRFTYRRQYSSIPTHALQNDWRILPGAWQHFAPQQYNSRPCIFSNHIFKYIANKIGMTTKSLQCTKTLSPKKFLPRELAHEILAYINFCEFCGRSGASELVGTLLGVHANCDGRWKLVIAQNAHDNCISSFCGTEKMWKHRVFLREDMVSATWGKSRDPGKAEKTHTL